MHRILDCFEIREIDKRKCSNFEIMCLRNNTQSNSVSKTVSSAEDGKGERDIYIISVTQFELWHLFSLWVWFHYKATLYSQRTNSFNIVTVKYKGIFVTTERFWLLLLFQRRYSSSNFSVVLIQDCCVNLLYCVKSEIIICSFQVSDCSLKKMYLIMHYI